MIRYKDVIDGNIIIEQFVNPPTLYFDTWFWRMLSDYDDLRHNFIDVGISSNASIMYSFSTLIELVRITDEKQIDSFLEIMGKLDYGFFYANPSKVIKREKNFETPEGGKFINNDPISDIEFIKEFHYSSDPLKEFNFADFFSYIVKNRDNEKYNMIHSNFGNELNPLLEQARGLADSVINAKNRLKNKVLLRKCPPFTKDILRYAIDFLEVNKNMNMPAKEWFDLLNTIVPVSYFNFVLLDKRWHSFIKNYFPLEYPDIAKVYWMQTVDNFLIDLESWPKA